MKRCTLMFLLLRKNVKQLKQFVNEPRDREIRDQRRAYIIGLKNELATLSPSKYNLMKTIATELDRFVIKNIVKDFQKVDGEHVIRHIIQDTDIVVSTEYDMTYHDFMKFTGIAGIKAVQMTPRGSEPDQNPWVLYDKIHNIHFLIFDDNTIVENVELFSGKDHDWFISVFKSLREVKESQEEIMRQQKIIEEQLIEERRKQNILSKYS